MANEETFLSEERTCVSFLKERNADDSVQFSIVQNPKIDNHDDTNKRRESNAFYLIFATYEVEAIHEIKVQDRPLDMIVFERHLMTI